MRTVILTAIGRQVTGEIAWTARNIVALSKRFWRLLVAVQKLEVDQLQALVPIDKNVVDTRVNECVAGCVHVP